MLVTKFAFLVKMFFRKLRNRLFFPVKIFLLSRRRQNGATTLCPRVNLSNGNLSNKNVFKFRADKNWEKCELFKMITLKCQHKTLWCNLTKWSLWQQANVFLSSPGKLLLDRIAYRQNLAAPTKLEIHFRDKRWRQVEIWMLSRPRWQCDRMYFKLKYKLGRNLLDFF